MKQYLLILIILLLSGCTQITSLNTDCETNLCCRNSHSDDTAPIRCPGNWFYDLNKTECEYKCYTAVFETCGADVQCETGTCAIIAGLAYCVDESPCEYLNCDNDCVEMESYPVQVRCVD